MSAVIPARYKEGNIEAIFGRTPKLGSHTELIFVECHSKDATYKNIAAGKKYADRDALYTSKKAVEKQTL